MPTPPFRSVQIFRLMFLLMLLHALAVGCAGKPTGTPILVDPTTTQRDVGGSDDILEVCQAMVTSMRRSPEVESKPVPRLVLLEAQEVYVDPLLQGYNARMLYNQFTAILNRVAGGEFKFIDRKTVSLERERQLSGAECRRRVAVARGEPLVKRDQELTCGLVVDVP